MRKGRFEPSGHTRHHHHRFRKPRKRHRFDFAPAPTISWPKPIDTDILELALNRAISHRNLLDKVKFLDREAGRKARFDELLGVSPSMQKLFSQISRVAETDISVLVSGESGTGKELVAHNPP